MVELHETYERKMLHKGMKASLRCFVFGRCESKFCIAHYVVGKCSLKWKDDLLKLTFKTV
jgi:hypothetical protein